MKIHKAQEWLEEGRKSIINKENPMDSFDDFYKALNSLYNYMEGEHERKKIKNLIQTKISQVYAKEILEKYNKDIDYLLSEPVIDMKAIENNTNRNIIIYRKAKNNIQKLQEIFMIIYQIRCNLDHGNKSPSRERDCILCQHSLPFLESIVAKCVE